MSPPVALAVNRCRRAAVVVLPDDRCDLFLLFEDLARYIRAEPGIEGIALVAASATNRSDALWLFRDFAGSRTDTLACSLLVIDDASHAFALLPDILRMIGAERFVFVGANVFLRQEGWAVARQALSARDGGLVVLGVEADALAARCFAWNTAAFSAWASTRPCFLGGFFRDNGLPAARATHADAAHATRVRVPTRTQEGVNAAVW